MALKIYAVGDIMLGEQPMCNNFGVASIIKKKGIDYLFNRVSSIFNDGDIIFGNLECSIMDENSRARSKPPFFCAEPAIIKGLVNANFNVLSVANNHIMENGEGIFQGTIQLLKDCDIHPVGLKNNMETITINGHHIAFLAYSFIEDNIPNSGYNKIRSMDPILEDIQEIKSLVDIVIISLHWGHEYVPYPSPEQVRIGRQLIDAGADIILGGHPHVTQSYEIYKMRPIFYSLGNFIFDHTYISMTRESFIAEISIDESLENFSVSIMPIVADEREYGPRIVDTPQKEEILKFTNGVRNLIEGRTLLEYDSSIGNYVILHSKYRDAAKLDMRVHFLRNFYRYSPSTLFSIIKKSIGKTTGDKI